MTLQNKKTHLLDNDADVSTSDVPDLFDQYGSGGDDVVTPVVSQSTEQSSIRPANDVDDSGDVQSVQNVSTQDNSIALPESKDVEKKWEQEYADDTPVPQKMDAKPVTTVTPPEASVAAPQSQKKNTKPAEASITQESITSSPVEQQDNSVVQAVSESGTPVQKQSMQPKVDISTREVHVDPSKKTIMIVDDDIDTMEMYADVFENADYNVIRAADGLEALSLLGDHTPHVIFTGIVMPRMDGFTMMESLKQNKRTKDIPVVINSHLGRDADKKRADELGARDFIVRGFTQPREVVERVGALLLRSDYIFRFNKADKEARKLAKDLGASDFFHCPQGQEMVLKLNIADEKELTFSARFSCVDNERDDKK